MPLPFSQNIEHPILQELAALGGTDDVRFLYERLIPYFPSLSDAEVASIRNGTNAAWRKSVQKAGRMLDENNLIKRDRGFWSLTDKGRRRVADEAISFDFSPSEQTALTHQGIQALLVELAGTLGFFGQAEFEYYDVVWRESPRSPRISHVFEVQSKGNIDSAFAKLKRAYDAQRSRPFLVLASERDTNRAHSSLTREFRELESVITILSFAEIRKIHENLEAIRELLPKFLAL
jgi:hypothetical protein